MDENSNFLLTFAPAMVLFGIVIIVLGIRRKRRNLSPAANAMEHFVVSSIAFGILLSILWMSLPSTPALKSFGSRRPFQHSEQGANAHPIPGLQ